MHLRRGHPGQPSSGQPSSGQPVPAPGRLYLVRHGLPVLDARRPAHEWPLDPAGFADIDRLRHSGRLPRRARWYCSPERKALETARRLTDAMLHDIEVVVVRALAEQHRGAHWFPSQDEHLSAVRRAFAQPEQSAVATWEPLSATRDRLLPAVRRILDDTPGEDVVLCGHGTAWTLLVGALTGKPPDVEAWARMRMPDLVSLARPAADWDHVVVDGTLEGHV